MKRDETENTLKGLREVAFKKLKEAEKAMYAYCCSCDIGPERERAFQIYENIRLSSRVA